MHIIIETLQSGWALRFPSEGTVIYIHSVQELHLTKSRSVPFALKKTEYSLTLRAKTLLQPLPPLFSKVKATTCLPAIKQPFYKKQA